MYLVVPHSQINKFEPLNIVSVEAITKIDPIVMQSQVDFEAWKIVYNGFKVYELNSELGKKR